MDSTHNTYTTIHEIFNVDAHKSMDLHQCNNDDLQNKMSLYRI